MSERLIKKGTRVLWGKPARPMPSVNVVAIGQAVARVPGIVEAYLPQCYIDGDKAAAQVLVIGVESKAAIPTIMEDLLSKLRLVLGPGKFLDVFPFEVASVPAAARVVPCFTKSSAGTA